jgi:hypothetical protein
VAAEKSLRDVDVPVAQFMVDGVPVSRQKVTARGLLEECRRSFDPYEKTAWTRAVVSERYLNGDQYVGLDYRKNEVVFDDWPSYLPRVTRNLLRNLHLTWQARVTKGDPSVKAWGGEASLGDVQSADVSNKLIAYWRQQQDHRRVISRAAWTCGSQGTVAFWTYWDTTKGPKGADGATPMGDICVEPLAVWEWMTDGSEAIEDSAYCAVRRYLDEETARMKLLKAGITDPPSVAPAQSVWGENRSLVECVYYYHKKTPRIPDGFFAIFVAGHVVEHGPFPYEHGELPIAVWKCSDKPDSPHGGTHLDDAIPLQASLNRLHAALASMTARSAKWLKVLAAKKIADLWNGEDQIIECDDPQAIQSLRIVGPPPPPPLLLSQIEEHERMINVVFGINEAIVGSDASATKNARHLAYISELDAQKFSATLAMRDHALLRLYRQMLSLCRQYVVVPRMLRITGDTGLPEIMRFVGSDLATDVYLEPAPGVDDTKTAEAVQAEQDAVAGFEDLGRAKERRQTGQRETSLEVITRKAVMRQAQQAMQGMAVQADDTLVPEIAVEVLLSFMEQNEQMGPDRLAGVVELLNAYRTLMQPEQPEQGGAPQEAPSAVPSASETPGALSQ